MTNASHGRSGLTLVEVVIALGMLALVVVAFSGLQVTNLRATRSSIETRTATSLLAYEAGMRSLLATDDAECLAAPWLPAGWSCRVSAHCPLSAACQVRRIEVEIELTSGRIVDASVVAHQGLEWAIFRPAAPAEPTEAEEPTEEAEPGVPTPGGSP